jgi:hypothetical protein
MWLNFVWESTIHGLVGFNFSLCQTSTNDAQSEDFFVIHIENSSSYKNKWTHDIHKSIKKLVPVSD